MAAEPDVTVVTVVLDAVRSGREREFHECLESVQRQIGCSVEHVVVDGGSQDGTLDVIRGFEGSKVPVICHSSPDHGIYEAMNKGISFAHGRYVVFLNSDDFFNDPMGLADSLKELASTGADFSYAPANVIDTNGNPVAHAFTLGRPLQIAEGMTICHQTMLTSKAALQRLKGFDERYRSAADYDLLLRMIFSGCRACRVAKPFVTFRLGGFSAANSDVCDREMGEIYRRNFNAGLNLHLSEGDGLEMRRSCRIPEAVACRLAACARKTYGEWYCLPDEQYGDLKNIMAGQLHEQVLPWSRNIRCTNRFLRNLLGFVCRRSKSIDSRARSADLDYLYRHMQRVEAADSGIDLSKAVVSKQGFAAVGSIDISFAVHDWLRKCKLRMGVLLRIDSLSDESEFLLKVNCGGEEVFRGTVAGSHDMRLVDFMVPSRLNRAGEMRVRLELSGDEAALVYGGLAFGVLR